MERFTITLSDSTQLKDLELNGNNFIAQEEVTEETFADNLAPVTISNGETEEVHEQMAFVQAVKHEDGKTWFVLRDVTEQEIRDAKLRSDIAYIAMMSDIELES